MEVDQILWVHESVAVLDIRDVSSLHSSPLSYFIWPSSQPGSGHRTQEHCTLHSHCVVRTQPTHQQVNTNSRTPWEPQPATSRSGLNNQQANTSFRTPILCSQSCQKPIAASQGSSISLNSWNLQSETPGTQLLPLVSQHQPGPPAAEPSSETCFIIIII